MNSNRQKLIDRMIRIYGFENPIVRLFVRWCEDWEENAWNDKALTLLVEAHEADPQIEQD